MKIYEERQEEIMQAWILAVMGKYGYFGIFLLILLENVFPPIPSEVILTFGGFMTTKTEMKVIGVIGMATLGSLIGAVILYGIGRLLNEERMIKIAIKYKILRIKPEDIEKTMNWYRKYEYKTVFFCRMIPIVRSLISIPAGIGKMPLLPFMFLTTIGSIIWNTVLVVAGAMLGEAWESILTYLDMYSNVVYLMIAIGGVLLAISSMRTKGIKE